MISPMLMWQSVIWENGKVIRDLGLVLASGLTGSSMRWDINRATQGVFQLENDQYCSHFRATRCLAPSLQLLWWCYIENKRTIWKRNGLIERPTLRGNFAKWFWHWNGLRERKGPNFLQLSYWKTPQVLIIMSWQTPLCKHLSWEVWYANDQ